MALTEKALDKANKIASGAIGLLFLYLFIGSMLYFAEEPANAFTGPAYMVYDAAYPFTSAFFGPDATMAYFSFVILLVVTLVMSLALLSSARTIAGRTVKASAAALTTADAHFRKGESLRDSHDYAGAIAEFEAARKKRPGYPGVQLNLGLCYMGMCNFATAASMFQEESSARPDSFDARLNAGYCYIRLGRLTIAEKELADATRLRPESAVAHLWLGDARRLSGKYAEADPEYRKAMEIDRDVEGLDLSLGENYLKLERLDDAVTALRNSAARNPRQDRARYLLGLALAKKGRYDEAIAEYNAAIGINPAEKTYADMLEVAKAAIRDSASVPAQKEIVREIVKIPCKYCGILIENTRDRCPGCGAPVK